MEGPGADSEEKREPVRDIDIAVVDSLKAPTGRLEKRPNTDIRKPTLGAIRVNYSQSALLSRSIMVGLPRRG
jgi:hypothetical protein